MNRRNLTFLLVGMAGLAIAIAGFLIAPPVDAEGSCGSCNGPVQTVVGSGNGATCSEAFQKAKTDAIAQSFSGGTSCTPCQTSVGAQVCFAPSCQGSCGPNPITYFYTLNYKCQACDPGGPEIQ